ncbi:hypothetical protein [Streptomyces sp. NPDC047315]|uniref:hypothetical protein n=1 Tax=Streptomyces sp. NPDC047315 TaxID=3155142 RepID=UPI00340A8E44
MAAPVVEHVATDQPATLTLLQMAGPVEVKTAETVMAMELLETVEAVETALGASAQNRVKAGRPAVPSVARRACDRAGIRW